MNSVSINGNLTADAELKYIGSKNTACVTFTIGKSKHFKNERGNIEKKSIFFQVVIYGPYAEKICPSLKKGTQAFIQGTLNAEYWEKDGTKHSRTNIIAQKVFVFGKNTNTFAQNTESTPPPSNPQQDLQSITTISGEEFMEKIYTMPDN
ncbi:single-stranded DNA-binding protein [Helicobacter sp. MIT 21-1697]|uniref:single-stranded DNA-binding protein n=1 Tax=Helicobacter sp. MIT 21-1697 TaxID=2993733 RepID=UPI00224A768A|nr:single-stranded DNA-binding protein [Helicobacter sp. MIT 21-1697]MCX2716818.1 single-stranded DNA-binding protein [Helicobacter sp. MIT 21-1697]